MPDDYDFKPIPSEPEVRHYTPESLLDKGMVVCLNCGHVCAEIDIACDNCNYIICKPTKTVKSK